MNLNLYLDFQSFAISHDGEADDIQALVIASHAVSDKDVYVDCVIGNPDIVHAPDNESQEMHERITLTNEIFQKEVAHLGAMSNDVIFSDYVGRIRQQSSQGASLVLHTASFKTL